MGEIELPLRTVIATGQDTRERVGVGGYEDSKGEMVCDEFEGAEKRTGFGFEFEDLNCR